MSTVQKLVGFGTLFLLIIGTGVLLSNLGKPYNTLAFSVHKLIALVTIIITVVLFYGLLKNAEIKAITLTLIIALTLSILALFISGALMSLGRAPYSLLKTVHCIATIITAVETMAVVYFLFNGKQ